MLIIIRAAQEQVVAAVEAAGVRANVGPTSASGWTAAWSDSDREILAGAASGRPHVVVDETSDWVRLLVAPGGEEPTELRWAEGDDGPHGDVAAAARQLAVVFTGSETGSPLLASRLRRPHGDADEVVEDLLEVLDLPELEPDAPERGVVLHHGEPSAVRLAAAIAGPSTMLAVGDGWTAVVPQDGGVGPAHLAAALSTGGGRKDRTLLLWRRGPASAAEVWTRGRLAAEWTWNDGWTLVSQDLLERESEVVAQLTRAAGGGVDAPGLRALLRRRTSADLLPELLDVLGLPREALALLDEPDSVADRVEPVPRASAKRALLEQFRTAHTKPVRPGLRVLYALYAAATVLLAAVSLVATLIALGVLTTNGAFVSQTGTSAEDVVWFLTFLALTVVLVPTAIHRVRRSWTSRQSREDPR